MAKTPIGAHRKRIDVWRWALHHVVIGAATSGQAADALIGFLNRRARELQSEREELLKEQRQLEITVAPTSDESVFDAAAYQRRLQELEKARGAAKPEELQWLLRLAVKNIGWSAAGAHKVQFYTFSSGKAKSNRSSPKPPMEGEENRFDFATWYSALTA